MKKNWVIAWIIACPLAAICVLVSLFSEDQSTSKGASIIAIPLVCHLFNGVQIFILHRYGNRYELRIKSAVWLCGFAALGLVMSITLPLGVVALLLSITALAIILGWSAISAFKFARHIVRRRANITGQTSWSDTNIVEH